MVTILLRMSQCRLFSGHTSRVRAAVQLILESLRRPTQRCEVRRVEATAARVALTQHEAQAGPYHSRTFGWAGTALGPRRSQRLPGRLRI
jgi:hypothetical protein